MGKSKQSFARLLADRRLPYQPAHSSAPLRGPYNLATAPKPAAPFLATQGDAAPYRDRLPLTPIPVRDLLQPLALSATSTCRPPWQIDGTATTSDPTAPHSPTQTPGTSYGTCAAWGLSAPGYGHHGAYIGHFDNNIAEALALLAAVVLARTNRLSELMILTDSEVVGVQLLEPMCQTVQCRSKTMKAVLYQIHRRAYFRECHTDHAKIRVSLKLVDRGRVYVADELARKAAKGRWPVPQWLLNDILHSGKESKP